MPPTGDPRQDVIDALVCERYGRPLWWTAPPAPDEDTEEKCARRLEELLEASSWKEE